MTVKKSLPVFLRIPFLCAMLFLNLPLAHAADWEITADTTWTNQADVPGGIDNLTIGSGKTLTIGGGNYETNPIVVDATGTIVVETGAAIVVVGEYTNNVNDHGHTLKAANITVSTNGAISADGKGFAADNGPGYEGSNCGGSYGGKGSLGGGPTYGDANSPLRLGSGGALNPGGGAIKLEVTGALTIEGSISANGSGPYGSGSGGSIFIIAGNLAGPGSISANGGGANISGWGAGGGGRVYISYTSCSFTGTVSAGGGTHTVTPIYSGEPGSFVYPDSFDDPGLRVENGGFYLLPGTYSMSNLTVSGYSTLRLTTSTGQTVTVEANDITVGTNSQIVMDGDTNSLYGTGSVIKASNMTIYGKITADGKGFAADNGPGYGGSNCGGSYGGRGGNAGGSTYGDPNAPACLGSGGAQSAGGGAIKIEVTGTLTIEGSISANGLDSNGAGSGGSIFIIAGNLAGSGSLSANGGNASASGWGGGGGGRVYISYTSGTFTGIVSAGGGRNTVYTPASGEPGSFVYPDSFDDPGLRVENGGFYLLPGTYSMSNLTVSGYSTLRLTTSTGQTITVEANDITVGTNSQIVMDGDTNSLYGTGSVIKASSMTLYGKITADGKGFAADNGPGYGGIYCGGSYGGIGGSAGGSTYGDTNVPTCLGSGGAQAAGGGAIKIEVTGAFTIDGSISADGLDANGAGSGGSIFIIAGNLAGAGSISADGGNASVSAWGAGGGGRIALYYSNSDTLSGSVTATGGVNTANSANDGGTGTVRRSALGVASLVSPEEGEKVSLRPALKVRVTDQDGDYLRLRIELATDSAFTSNLTNFNQTVSQEGFSGQNAESGTAYTNNSIATFTLVTQLTEDTWYWRAYAVDPGGTTIFGLPSETRSFDAHLKGSVLRIR